MSPLYLISQLMLQWLLTCALIAHLNDADNDATNGECVTPK